MFPFFLAIISVFSFAQNHNDINAVMAVENNKAFLTENHEDLVDIQPIEDWRMRKAKMTLLNTNDPQAAEKIQIIEKSNGEKLSYEFIVEGETLVFQPQRIYKDVCGTKIVEAKSFGDGSDEKLELILKDYSGYRPCKDLIDYEWHAKVLSSFENQTLEYKMVGNPQ